MKAAYFLCLVVGVGIQSVLCEGIQTQVGGSKKCPDLSLQNLPVNSEKYRSLLILNGRQRESYDSFKDFRVLSVKYVALLHHKRSQATRILKRWSILKTQNNLGYLQLKTRSPMPQKFQVIVELNFKGIRCFLRSVFDSTDVYNGQINHKRKLLEVKSEDNNSIQLSVHVLSWWLTVATVLSMVIVLAICACGKRNIKEAISDEIGGVVVDNNIVSLSSTDRSDDGNERRETANSKKIDRLSTGENGSARTASQSSQQNDLTIDSAPHLNSTSSHSSASKITQAPPPLVVDVKVEDISLKTSNPGTAADKDRVRSQSTKEQSSKNSEPEDPKGFSQSDNFFYRGNEANIASSSIGKKQTVQPVIRKGSDKKENKDQQGKEKKKSWIRRRSSKNKDDKKAGGRNSRHSEVPLPPTPDGVQPTPAFPEEENQYETVETRPRKIQPEPVSKLRPAAAEPGRPSSDLYASIDDEHKRNSTGSHMYDVVETRKKLVKVEREDKSRLEYAYAVVAPKDKPINPTQTSSGSGLYEVVTDDMKRNIPTVTRDDDYAVVQKDNSKKRSTSQPTRPLSDTDVVPTPPSLIHLPSQKQRAKSLGANLNGLNENKKNILDFNQPTNADHTYAMVIKQRKTENNGNNSTNLDNDSSKPTSTKDYTYAKINKERKSVRSNQSDDTETISHMFVDDDDDDDDDDGEPPPIPPSLYAELLLQEEGGGEAGPPPSNTDYPTTTIINTESVVKVTNEADKDFSHTRQSQSSSEVVKRTTPVNSLNKQSSSKDNKGMNIKKTTESQSESTVIISVDPPSKNPLYDEIHYV